MNASNDESRVGALKSKAVEEFRSFLGLFLYLWLLFGVFALNQAVVLREQGLGFTMQGFAVINALVFAKVMMVFEMLDPGRWLRRRPLIYPILFETALLTAMFLIVHVLEKVIRGVIEGKSAYDSLPTVGGGGVAGLVSASIIVFVALTPFFGLRNLDIAMGRGRLWAIIFGQKSAPPGGREESGRTSAPVD